jgi:hypothetical protein
MPHHHRHQLIRQTAPAVKTRESRRNSRKGTRTRTAAESRARLSHLHFFPPPRCLPTCSASLEDAAVRATASAAVEPAIACCCSCAASFCIASPSAARHSAPRDCKREWQREVNRVLAEAAHTSTETEIATRRSVPARWRQRSQIRLQQRAERGSRPAATRPARSPRQPSAPARSSPGG